jgi:hypothetical protein
MRKEARLDFINLNDAVDAVAGRVQVAETISADTAEIERTSRAAAVLHAELFNAEVEPPRWAEVSKETGKPLLQDVRDEGLKLLESVAGWARRRRAEMVRYADECRVLDVEPDPDPFHVPEPPEPDPVPSHVPDIESGREAEPRGHRISIKPIDGKYGAARFWRDREIGFDRSELIRFLDACGLAHSLETRLRQIPIDETTGGSAGAADSVTSATDTPIRQAGERWTPEQLAELKADRERYGTKVAAERHDISETRVRKLLPAEKETPSAHNPFGKKA